MIHYYLAYKHFDNNITHGEKFQKMAEELNSKFGLNVTVKIDTSKFKRAPSAPKLSYFFACIVLIHEMIHLYVYQEIGSGLRHKKPSIDKMNELNAQYGLDIRKDAKHLRDKYIKKKNEKKSSTGWLHQLKILLRPIL